MAISPCQFYRMNVVLQQGLRMFLESVWLVDWDPIENTILIGYLLRILGCPLLFNSFCSLFHLPKFCFLLYKPFPFTCKFWILAERFFFYVLLSYKFLNYRNFNAHIIFKRTLIFFARCSRKYIFSYYIFIVSAFSPLFIKTNYLAYRFLTLFTYGFNSAGILVFLWSVVWFFRRHQISRWI